MAPNEDLKTHATSSFDFYNLLSLPTTFSQKDLDRARRLTSFKYHPDKVGDDISAREKLHLTNIGYEILNDPELRSLYDNARNSRARKKASEARLEASRRKLKDELEARELAGFKAASKGTTVFNETSDEDQRLKWLADDGERRRIEMQADRERASLPLSADNTKSPMQQSTSNTRQSNDDDIPELERSVKITLSRPNNSTLPPATLLVNMLERFGKVDGAFFVRNKHAKVVDMGTRSTAYIVFTSQAGAIAAVQEWRSINSSTDHNAGLWPYVHTVIWAGEEEPEGLREGDVTGIMPQSEIASTGQLHESFLNSSVQNPFISMHPSEPSLESYALSRLLESTDVQNIAT